MHFRIEKLIIGTAAYLVFGALSLGAQSEQFFRGQVCLGPEGRAPITVNGQTGLPCLVAHPKRGAKYVLLNFEKNTLYQLDDRAKAKAFAGVNVFVSGTLDETAATIHVTDVIPDLPSKITQAQTVYIKCDACPRGMAVAWSTAFQYLTEWGRFDIVPDPKKADLIFLFSANQYGGDYLTRDGPDTRGVDVKITFLDIIDPNTGQSLWSDDRWWGSLYVSQATRDLLSEFKGHLAFTESQNERAKLPLDRIGEGRVSKREFLKLMDAEFDRLDTNKDGDVDIGKLKQLGVTNVSK